MQCVAYVAGNTKDSGLGVAPVCQEYTKSKIGTHDENFMQGH